MNKILILDKDGTLVTSANGETFINVPWNQKLILGVKETIEKYCDDGWIPIIASSETMI